jgi:hypothetical protein
MRFTALDAVLTAVLFKLLVELSTPTLFCMGAPMNAQVHVVKNR